MSSTNSASEYTPLLDDRRPDSLQDVDIYSRFTFFEKQRILAIASFSAVLTFFASGSFVPTIAVVARDLKTTQSAVNVTVGMYLLFVALGGLLWGTYSGYYGRRPMYLFALPLYIVGSFGVAMSQSLGQLAVMRSIQGFGTSCFATTGVATVSDIFRLEERGRALGVYWCATLIGPALAPIVGGAASRYFSWRIMQCALGTGAVIALILVTLWLPETSHPNTTGYAKEMERFRLLHPQQDQQALPKPFFVWLNPLKNLYVLGSPNLLCSAIMSATALATDVYLLIPLSHVFERYYGIKNEMLIGVFFLPAGLGNMIGSPVTGWLSDRLIIKGKSIRGRWLPEDRLKATWPGAIAAPISILGYGLTARYVQGSMGVGLNLFWLFINGIAITNVLGPCGVYGVDIFYTRSAEVVSALNAFRYVIAAGTASIVLPMIETIGIAETGAVFAAFACFSCGLLWATIKYGEEMRAWRDMGYTMKET